ncbi:MAG: hypothetical protein H7A45_06965 [Verrucomicrobiales bacterium]|nr:hypothetical protein [Verrucomicrobiales bacterium]
MIHRSNLKGHVRSMAGLVVIMATALAAGLRAQPSSAGVWVSTSDGRLRLAAQPSLSFGPSGETSGVRIAVQPEGVRQPVLGLGSSLEPATCWNLSLMEAADRRQVLRRLLDPVEGIGMSLMRICIGTPDFTGDEWYTYDDLPPGATDPELGRFSIERDRRYILPVLREARAVNPDLRFFASPWSPPGWMKTTGSVIGGELKPEWYAAYARYFVRFIQAYAAEGIPVHAVTIQNEPGVDRAKERDPDWFYPSCHWTGEQERDFIRDHLGPTFERHGLGTEIWCYDHNYNVRRQGDDPGLGYPRTILSDPAAARYVDGVAFHGYAGRPTGMRMFHEEFPEVPLYFTETSVYGVQGAVQIIEFLRNWAGSYSAWVTILDEHQQPNNGPFDADPTCVIFHSDTRQVSYEFDYFMYGQFMKFIRPGARRIESTPEGGPLPNVAVRNPDGALVLVLANPSARERPFTLVCGDQQARGSALPASVTTLRWTPPSR